MIARKYYLICTTHRTGSNLLTQNLRQTSVAGSPTEHFSPVHAPKISKRRGITNPNVSLTQYVQGLTKQMSSDNKVFGTKIMWSHLAVIRDQWKKDPDRVQEVGDDLWEPIRHFFPGANVIWLRRRDKLRQAISMVRAKQTKIYSSMHLHTGERRVRQAPEYSFKHIWDNMRRMTRNDEAWGSLFEQIGIQPITVWYEEMCKNPKQAAYDLVGQMGFAQDGIEWTEVEHSQQRISDTINDEWYAQYRREEADYAIKAARAREARRYLRYYNDKWERNQKTFLGKCKNKLNHFLGKEPPNWKPGMVIPKKGKKDGAMLTEQGNKGA